VEEAREPAPPAVDPEASAAAEVEEARSRGDVSAYGPEGSRLVAILRVDRLRAGPEARPYIAAVDDLLRLLPDRRRLLDETGLDLYRDFDALLVATPNPMDDTATFLAAPPARRRSAACCSGTRRKGRRKRHPGGSSAGARSIRSARAAKAR
jgi:hypothetical protein